MKHSNNAARIRLWMNLKRPGGMSDLVETRMVQYTDLKTRAFTAINPLKKVPALIRADGATVFESNVILGYLEDKFGSLGPAFIPPTPEKRQEMELLIRIHDLYVASPNNTSPGFSHNQGAMYLSTGWHGPARGMDMKARADKLNEIWQRLCWLEAQCSAGGGPHLLGEPLSLADLTWFPTCVFMEYLLPRCFGWPHPFDERATQPAATPFPALASWYTALSEVPEFAAVRADITSYWAEMDQQGQFEPILREVAHDAGKHKLTYGVPQTASLNYQTRPPPGKAIGRYIGQPDAGDVVDEHEALEVTMCDGRELYPAATLPSMGFELAAKPTMCADFRDDAQVVGTYYGEMIELIKEASGATRVFIFDHTIRESGNTNLNATAGGAAAPVPRVHCDYTAEGAPRRLEQLGKQGIFSRVRGRVLSEEDVAELAAGRFAFINVWRSICEAHPVLQKPLAVADERSIPEADRMTYELRFADRTGENYSLAHSEAHRWYYYPKMTCDECLVFKVYDKHDDGPRFVFHTAFDDPSSPPDAPPRKSIEVRGIAFFDTKY